MNIKEIVAGTQVTLHVEVGDKKLDLEVTAPFLSEDELRQLDAYQKKQNVSGILLDVVRKDNLIVSLSNKAYKITASVIKDSMHHSFEISGISTIRMSNGSVYYFVQFKREEGTLNNRRESFRVDIMTKGTMSRLGTKEVYDVIVHDLSATGAGLLVDAKTDVALNHRYAVRFSSESGEQFEFHAKVVRIADAGRDRILLGCELTTKSRSLDQYLVRLQLRSRENK